MTNKEFYRLHPDVWRSIHHPIFLRKLKKACRELRRSIRRYDTDISKIKAVRHIKHESPK